MSKLNAAWRATSTVILVWFLGISSASADDAVARVVPQGTEVIIAIDDPVASATSKPGDRFHLHLAAPLVVGSAVLAPSGAKGEGEVVHAERARSGGRAGELILAARFLEVDGVRIPLGHFRWSAVGTDAEKVAMLTWISVKGGDVTARPGSIATASTAAEVVLPQATSKP